MACYHLENEFYTFSTVDVPSNEFLTHLLYMWTSIYPQHCQPWSLPNTNIITYFPMSKNCPFKQNGVPQTDPTNGKLFRSQRSPLNVMSTDFAKQTNVSVWGTKVSVCGICLKEKSEDISRLWRLSSIEGKQFSINRNHFRTW